MPIIEAKELTRKFGKLTAVENLNLEVERGEVLGFLGPNGAGKTTTIRMLSGIIAPTSGYAVIDGMRTDGSIERLHQVIGLLTESPGFYNRLTAYRNLEYFAGFYENLQVPVQVEKYLKIMGLWERRADPVGAFSKGMKQRLALARALMHEPKVLFLDEPTAGLDPEAAGEVRELVRKLSTEGRTIFLSTHNLAEAEQLCGRIAIFRSRLISLDTPANLRRTLFKRRITIRLEKVTESILAAVDRLPFVKSLIQQENKITLELNNAEKESPEIVQNIVQSGGRIIEVTKEQHSLEEIYLNLVREEGGKA
jgi:ABC-2 type transport system ATP-binding protein